MSLHDRALSIDSTSITSMHNRTAWAKLEADVGDLNAARELLEEGLQMHPTFVPALLGLARVHRIAGRWTAAQEALRTAQQLTHQFNTEALRERALLLRALGERDMSASVEAHLRAVTRVIAAKRAGINTQKAWDMLISESRRPGRQQLAQASFARKQELGWLSAPGVPGPKGARRPRADGQGGVPYVPLPGPPGATWQGAIPDVNPDGQEESATQTFEPVPGMQVEREQPQPVEQETHAMQNGGSKHRGQHVTNGMVLDREASHSRNQQAPDSVSFAELVGEEEDDESGNLAGLLHARPNVLDEE